MLRINAVVWTGTKFEEAPEALNRPIEGGSSVKGPFVKTGRKVTESRTRKTQENMYQAEKLDIFLETNTNET